MCVIGPFSALPNDHIAVTFQKRFADCALHCKVLHCAGKQGSARRSDRRGTIIQNHKVLFVCAEESRSASNNSLFMTEEAGETFNPICNHTKPTIL